MFAVLTLRPIFQTFKLFIFIFLILLLFNSNANALESNKSITNTNSSNSLLVKTLTNHVNKHSRLNYLRHRKRCHYAEKSSVGVESTPSSSSRSSALVDDSKITFNLVKQQRVRDQNRHYVHHHQASKNALMDQTETEQLYANIGDTINLTCSIDTREIDWHFKDRNLTTTILSYGLQLQVAPQPHQLFQQQIQYDLNDAKYNDYDDATSSSNYKQDYHAQPVKYRVSSDRQSIHMLTLYVQGNQDEGSYQCVDSKSEIPIKKTIRVILSNDLIILFFFNYFIYLSY